MPIDLTIRITSDSTEEIRALVADLISRPLTLSHLDASEAALTPPVSDIDSDLDQRRVDRVWKRIGPEIRRWLVAAAEKPDGWTSDQLAGELGVETTTIRSHAANLGRTNKGVSRDLGSSGVLYAWDDERGAFVMSEAVRQAILDKARASQPAA